MSTTLTIDPVTVITQLAENQLTEAIIVAAKATKKPRAPKKSKPTTPPENDTSIVDEIVANLSASKYAVEAAANLTRIFGREFDTIAEQIVTMASNLSEDTVIEVSVPKKPRAKKEKKVEDVVSTPLKDDNAPPPPPAAPVKKPRAKKENEVAVSEPSEEVAPVKKPKAKKEKEVAPLEKVALVKKPRSKKEKEVVHSPLVEEVVPSPLVEGVALVKKPKAKKEKSTEPVPTKEKKQKKGTTNTDGETTSDKDRSPTPLLPEEVSVNGHDDQNINAEEMNDQELVGFTSQWGSEELVEEELSDIEEDA